MIAKIFIIIGIYLIILAFILFIVGIIYPKTFGKKIKEELNREYNIK